MTTTPSATRPVLLGSPELPWCLALLALASWLTLASPVLPPTIPMDAASYLAMADDPGALFRVAAIHAQRPLPPLLVWGLGHLGVEPAVGFHLLSASAFHLFLPFFFLALRAAGAGPSIAFGTAVFLAVSAWPVPYALSNVYQACDALAYPLGLAIVVGVALGRPGLTTAAALAGAATRQQLVLLGVAALLEGYRRSGRRAWLVGAALVASLFATLVLTVGDGGGASRWSHTGAVAGRLGTAVRATLETRLPVLLSPFLLLLLVDARAVARYAAREWWVALYAVAAVVQPLLAFSSTGASNAVRLAMLGVWPAFLLAGLRLEERWLTARWARWVYVALPLTYGTAHLVSVGTTWPSPVGHRAVVNLLVLALCLAAAWRSRGRPAPNDERPRGA